MNYPNNLFMQEKYVKEQSATEKLKPLTGVSAEVLKFQAFADECIERGLKGQAIKKLAEQNGLNFSYVSLINKINAYKKNGIKSLMRKERKDKNEMKAFSDSVLMLLKGMYRDYQCVVTSYKKCHEALMSQSIKFLHRGNVEYDIKNDGEGRFVLSLSSGNIHAIQNMLLESGAYITKEGEELLIGDYASAARYLKVIKQNNNDLYFFNRYGVENYRLKKQKAMRLDYSRMNPNDMWCLDGKQVDILVISECGRYVFRPWLSGIIRAATREYHYEACASPNSEAIANAITSAVAKWGVPKEMNFDRGKDYKSHRIQQLMGVLKCKKRQSIRKLARSKMIESFHNILDNLLKHLPGYTGNNRNEMPQETRDMLRKYTTANKEIKKYEKFIQDGTTVYISLNSNPEGRLRQSKERFLFFNEFITQLEKALDEYHSRKHGGLQADELGKRVYDRMCEDEVINRYGEKLNTPNGRLEYKIEKGFQPVYTQPAAIAMFAMNSEIRTVQDKDGIEFKGGLFWDARLRTVIGQRVLIRFTNGNTNELYVFHSEQLQGFTKRKDLTDEVISNLKYICLAKVYDKVHYNDPIYKEEIRSQRGEEKRMLQTLGKSKLYQMNGMESELPAILKDEEEKNSQNNIEDNEYREMELY